MTIQNRNESIPTRYGGPARFYGNCCVIFDDHSRFQWRRSDRGEWRFDGTWPTAQERRAVARYVGHGGQLLVVIPAARTTYSAFAEEVPSHLSNVVSSSEGDLVDFDLKPLDWLPNGLRSRAKVFIQLENARWAKKLSLFRPSIMIDRPDDAQTNVRFVLLSPGTFRYQLERHLEELVTSLFPDRQTPVSVKEPRIALRTWFRSVTGRLSTKGRRI